jgi:hypothetical protein
MTAALYATVFPCTLPFETEHANTCRCRCLLKDFLRQVSARELFALFAPHGRVTSVELATAGDGRSLRIAEIHVERSEDADWTTRLLHRSYMDGELILVPIAIRHPPLAAC